MRSQASIRSRVNKHSKCTPPGAHQKDQRNLKKVFLLEESSLATDYAEAVMKTRTRPVRRILVIDGNCDLCRLCADVLIDSGFQVDTAADGKTAWKALEAVRRAAHSYDLLITDDQMPDVSGLRFVERLRAARMVVPVILASGKLPPAILASVVAAVPIAQSSWNRSLQIAAVLPKPFTIDELLGTVKEVLRT